MVHVEEHKLEMYVLGARDVLGERPAIEEHLRECAGCRMLAERMASFYLEADREYAAHLPGPGREHDFRPAVVHRNVQSAGPRAGGRFPVPFSRIDRLVRLSRRHPVLSTAGSLGAAAAVVLALILIVRSPFRDLDPAYVHLNPASDTYEVLNRENELIRSLPGRSVSAVRERENATGYPSFLVTDLNRDGRHEIITNAPFAWESNPDLMPLRVFSPDLRLIHDVRIGHPVKFGAADYHGIVPVTSFIADTFNGEDGEEILATGTNGRSPCVLSRFDRDCTLLGEFWHFGNLPVVQEITVPPGNTKLLVLAGINDVNDGKWESFPVIIVVDPAKISGVTESLGTRGFGMAASAAEVMYIRLPRDDVSRALNHKGLIRAMSLKPYDGGDRLVFNYQSDYVGQFADYFFSFTPDFRLIDVNTSDQTRHLFKDLVRARRLRGTLDDAFLANLARGVRYWDGRAWTNEWTRITPPPAATPPTAP